MRTDLATGRHCEIVAYARCSGQVLASPHIVAAQGSVEFRTGPRILELSIQALRAEGSLAVSGSERRFQELSGAFEPR